MAPARIAKSRLLSSGEARIGAHGNPVVFAHSGDFCGVPTEFEEVAI
ncbi:hypothetical protein X971_5036 (plasmid) [Agrobacterium tumefaciens LBA4213 (Ach5)]|nr:hypothetical protein X971_5036 [Agrobacterium tumefaciens LBA4213 (Ach5)]